MVSERVTLNDVRVSRGHHEAEDAPELGPRAARELGPASLHISTLGRGRGAQHAPCAAVLALRRRAGAELGWAPGTLVALPVRLLLAAPRSQARREHVPLRRSRGRGPFQRGAARCTHGVDARPARRAFKIERRPSVEARARERRVRGGVVETGAHREVSGEHVLDARAPPQVAPTRGRGGMLLLWRGRARARDGDRRLEVQRRAQRRRPVRGRVRARSRGRIWPGASVSVGPVV